MLINQIKSDFLSAQHVTAVNELLKENYLFYYFCLTYFDNILGFVDCFITPYDKLIDDAELQLRVFAEWNRDTSVKTNPIDLKSYQV